MRVSARRAIKVVRFSEGHPAVAQELTAAAAGGSPLSLYSSFASEQVQVKRRETERQVEMRMSSYAYLQSIEAEEPWVKLAAHAPDSVPADNVWAALKLNVDADIPMTLGRQAYLDALLPGQSSCFGM